MAEKIKTIELVSKVIDNKYELLEPLGEGGMSVVYKARRLRINDEVAVKLLHPEVTLDSVSQIRFEREAQAAARIKHPNIVTIHDFGTSNEGLTYLVMELLQGPTLSDELSKYNGLAVERALNILIPVCQAIAAAHYEGIIHRDLKPSNILLHKLKDGTEVVKVVDFGIVKVRSGEALTQVNNILGTPHYMSPEQCYSRDLDARSDIYSLAIIGYEMLTGRLPFNEASVVEILQAHVEKTPVSPRQFQPAIPVALESALLRALSKKPEQRQDSAHQFAQELLAGAGLATTQSNTGSHKRYLETPAQTPVSTSRSGSNIALKPDTVNRRPPKSAPDFDNFVGRKRELERLVAEYQNLVNGKSRPVLLLGEKGFGLSRLGEEFINWLKKQNIPVLLTKFYEPTNRAQLPFQPWLDLLRRMFNIHRQEIIQEVELANLIAERSEVILPKCMFENRSLDDAEKWSVFESVASAITQALNDRLGVLVFDNLEYAHISLELLSYLIRNFRSRTLFVFLTNNEKATQKGHLCQEWLAGLARSGGYETIKLQALNQAELRSMLEGIFGHLEILERDIERIWKVSQGNPYYTAEIIRYLLNEGKITLQPSNWVCESIQDFILPESLQQLAEIKLSQVSQQTIELLRQAAVIGQQFTFDLLEKVSGINEDELIDSLEKAVKARIIEETEKREEEYSFPDPTIRFVLYEAIPRRRRRKLHLQVAQAIETLAGKNQNKLLRHSTALLHHYYEAGEIEKTFRYGRSAAEAAFSQLDIAEAEKYYQWALTAANEMQEEGNAPDPAELAELYLGSAQIALHIGQIEKAGKALSKSEVLTQFHKSGTIVCRTQLIKSQIEYYSSSFELALEAAEIGLSAAQSCKDAKLESGLLLMLAQIFTSLGKTEEALDALECNLDIAKQQKDHLTESRVLSLLGSTLGLIGNFKQGFLSVEEALKISHSNKDRIGELQALLRLGQLYIQTMQLERALEAYDCGLELARILETKLDEGMFENGRGDVYRYLSEMALAQECYKKSMQIAQSMDNPSGQALANHNLGLVTLELGIYYDAVKKLEAALAQHTKLGELRLAAEIYCALGYAREQIGQIEQAQQAYQTAIEHCQQIIHPCFEWQAHYGLANIFWMFGQTQESLAELTIAQEIIDHLCNALPEHLNLEEFMRDKQKVKALMSDVKQSLESE